VPLPKGEPKDPLRPLPPVDARVENGDALDAWLKFRVGFRAVAPMNGFLEGAFPKAGPFPEPPRAAKGDADPAKLDSDELAKVRVGFEGAAPGTFSLLDIGAVWGLLVTRTD
jgi:hypothetical protein